MSSSCPRIARSSACRQHLRRKAHPTDRAIRMLVRDGSSKAFGFPHRSGSRTTSAPRFRIGRDESSSKGPKRKIWLPVSARIGRLCGSAVRIQAESEEIPCKRDERFSNGEAWMKNGAPPPSIGGVWMKNSARWPSNGDGNWENSVRCWSNGDPQTENSARYRSNEDGKMSAVKGRRQNDGVRAKPRAKSRPGD